MEKRIRELFNNEIIKEAGKLFNTAIESIKEVGGFENYIYEYEKAGINYILRISHSHHRDFEAVKSELDWVNYLAQNGANVSTPVRSINNNLVEKIDCEEGYFIITSYIKASGHHVRKEDISDKMFYHYGKTVGKLHRLTKAYQPSADIKPRMKWYEDSLLVNAPKYLPSNHEVFIEKFNQLIAYLKELPMDTNSYGLIHTDIHMGNFFIDDDSNITVFDFDDCSYLYFISDIAIVVFYYIMFIRDEETRVTRLNHLLENFMKGYKEENIIDPFWFKQLPYFLKLREYILYIVIYRSLNIEESKWAQTYMDIYKTRIFNDIPFANIDYTKYC